MWSWSRSFGMAQWDGPLSGLAGRDLLELWGLKTKGAITPVYCSPGAVGNWCSPVVWCMVGEQGLLLCSELLCPECIWGQAGTCVWGGIKFENEIYVTVVWEVELGVEGGEMWPVNWLISSFSFSSLFCVYERTSTMSFPASFPS